MKLSGSLLLQSGCKALASDPQRRNTEQNQAGLGLMALSDLQSMAREEGEGMENTETESQSPALTPLPSLEHLLISPDPKQGTFEKRAASYNVIAIPGLHFIMVALNPNSWLLIFCHFTLLRIWNIAKNLPSQYHI